MQRCPRKPLCYIFGLILFTLLTSMTQVGIAADEPSARIYRSPEERRDAGVGREITDWLKLSSLAEFETEYFKNRTHDGNSLAGKRQTSQSLQFGLEAEITDRIIAELIYEYEIEREHGSIDEAIVDFETGKLSITLGRENISFGEYFSHFASSPLLEFGETRADVISAGYKFTPWLETFGFVFQGDANYINQNRSKIDYGGGFEITTNNESFTLGISYLSDLAESDEFFLAEAGNRYQEKVAGLNAYLLLGMPEFELTAEFITALGQFRELETDRDQPAAYNLEIAWSPNSFWQLALRLEGSKEMEDEVETQYGISSSWLLGKTVYLSLDYLYGQYQPGFVTDENELNDRQFVTGQISVEF